MYIHESVAGPVPFFIVKWRGTDWYFDVPLNLPAEPAEQASAFVEQEGNIIVLILCDYPSGRVRATRAINIEQETMRRIKEACEQQTTTRAVNVAIDECYAKVPLEHKIDEAIIQ